jgi:para-aminobenzoate synthetase component 1
MEHTTTSGENITEALKLLELAATQKKDELKSVLGGKYVNLRSVIAENEDPRGPYCGILGWVQKDQAELSVAIRVFWKDDKLRFGTGAGITFSSNSLQEWDETELKASRLIKIAQGENQ